MPVSRHASGMRTVSAVGAHGAKGRLDGEAADTSLGYIGLKAGHIASSAQLAPRRRI